MTDLIVDPQIRTWVFLPIVLLTYLAGVLRHYLIVLLRNERPVQIEKIRESQSLQRAELTRRNGRYLPRSGFEARRNAFVAENIGTLQEVQSHTNRQQMQNVFGEDSSALRETFIANLVNYLPMVLIGSWLMYQLSGFILTKIPIPLTLRFKQMLQKDIYLSDLEAEWVSSASWYFLNVFGMKSIYAMTLGENNYSEQSLDHTAVGMPQIAGRDHLKNEVEALVMCQHVFFAEDEEEKQYLTW